MGDWLNSIAAYRDRKQQKKAEKEREILNKHINSIIGVTFGRECMEALGIERIRSYEKAVAKIIRNFNDVDPSDVDPLELDDEITILISEYQDAVDKRYAPRIETCLKALLYASVARKLHMPVKADRDKIMQKKLDDLKSYRNIIEFQKSIAQSEDSLKEQNKIYEEQIEKSEAAKAEYKRFREEHPGAYAELTKAGSVDGSSKIDLLSETAQTLQGYMEVALDLRDDSSYISQVIAINKKVIRSCNAQIQRARMILSQRMNAIDEDTIKRMEQTQEHFKADLDRLGQSVGKLRDSHHRATIELEKMAQSEEARKRVIATLRELEAMEAEENKEDILAAEGKARLEKEALEKAKAKKETLEKLRGQRDAYAKEREDIEEMNRAYEQEFEEELNAAVEEEEIFEEEDLEEEILEDM